MGQCSLPPVFILLQYLQFLLEHALKSGLSVGSFALGADWTSQGLDVMALIKVSLQFLGLR